MAILFYTSAMSISSSLHTHFGFDTFRVGQEDAIQSLLNKVYNLP